MAIYKGVTVAVIVSLCAVPLVKSALSHNVVSQFLPMCILNYSLLLTAAVFFTAALPPNICCHVASKRNEIYYMCCLFMCLCTGNATVQAWRLRFFAPHNPKVPFPKVGYLLYDEPFLTKPFGISTQLWNDFVNYFLYAAMIFMIDNDIPYRDVALYWCGGTLTSEFVSTIGAFTGMNSHQLHYSEIKRIVYISATSWVLFKFLVCNPRYIRESLYSTRFWKLDRILIFFLMVYSFFGFFRGLAGLNGRQRIVIYYVSRYEPYILHPSKFGAVWVLYTAVYGVPFHLAAIKSLIRPTSDWIVNMSILYAGSLLQGTCVYLSYSFYPSSDPKYRTPSKTFFFVMLVNILLVVVAHVLMYRCVMEPGYFNQICFKSKGRCNSLKAFEHSYRK